MLGLEVSDTNMYSVTAAVSDSIHNRVWACRLLGKMATVQFPAATVFVANATGA